MKLFISSILSFGLLLPTLTFAQEQNLEGPKQGHTNQNKFRQLYNEFSTPNDYRTASGAPGPDYYQQRADYVMDIKIDDETQRLYGEETITYTNNSPNALAYLWVQLDQNIRKKDSPALLKTANHWNRFRSCPPLPITTLATLLTGDLISKKLQILKENPCHTSSIKP